MAQPKTNIRFSLINKLFNVSDSEWPRIFVSWAVTFLYRFGFVIGWTIITAMFVSRFGINNK